MTFNFFSLFCCCFLFFLIRPSHCWNELLCALTRAAPKQLPSSLSDRKRFSHSTTRHWVCFCMQQRLSNLYCVNISTIFNPNSVMHMSFYSTAVKPLWQAFYWIKNRRENVCIPHIQIVPIDCSAADDSFNSSISGDKNVDRHLHTRRLMHSQLHFPFSCDCSKKCSWRHPRSCIYL